MTIADKFQAIAENEQKVYDKGYSDGAAQGGGGGGSYDAGYEAGKGEAYAEVEPLNAELEQTLYGTDTGGKSFYDAFWDDKTHNWTRTDYTNAFSNDICYSILPPPRVIQVKSAGYMFCASAANNTENFDFSLCTNFNYCFNWATIKNAVVDMSSDTNNHSAMFTGCTAESVSLSGTDNLTTGIGMGQMYNLKEVRIEGVFHVNLNIGQSTLLSRDSILNIFNAMSATPVSGATLTLSTTAVNKAFGSTSAQEWLDLVNPKRAVGWTISLA